MDKKHYWKVVSLTDTKDVYKSAIITTGKYSATYKVGKRTKASIPSNGIFVFETREQARLFKCNSVIWKYSKLFKVKVFGNEIINPFSYHTSMLRTGQIVDYHGYAFPEGTHCFPEIELVKEQ